MTDLVTERAAAVIASAQNVPFIGKKQRKIAEYLDEEGMLTRTRPEYCRECRDENWSNNAVPAVFILWGKLFPPEALGPRCYAHAAKHVGERNMSQIDQWAVFDLRPYRGVQV